MSTNSERAETDEDLWAVYRDASLDAVEGGAPDDLRHVAREVAEKYLARPYEAGLRAVAAAAWDELADSLPRGMTIPANPYRRGE